MLNLIQNEEYVSLKFHIHCYTDTKIIKFIKLKQFMKLNIVQYIIKSQCIV